MCAFPHNEKIDRFTCGIVRRKVKQLINRPGFTFEDRDDLEQELIARVLQSLPTFDPAKAHRNGYVTAVVERFVANLVRDKRAAKRDFRRVCSLNIKIGFAGERPLELSDTVGHLWHDARLGRRRSSDESLAQLGLDIAAVMATLPAELSDLAERLKAETISEIARSTGIPRTTLNESVRRLRRRFERAGLNEYL